MLGRNNRNRKGAPAVSPVVVRSDSYDPETRQRDLERELGPVIEIMNRTGIAAAGIQVTHRDEMSLNREAGLHDKADIEQLLMAARAVIHAEAEKTSGLFALSKAMIVLQGIAVTVLGDERPGQLWEHPVRLVRAEETRVRIALVGS
jgi:hypothetical protein